MSKASAGGSIKEFPLENLNIICNIFPSLKFYFDRESKFVIAVFSSTEFETDTYPQIRQVGCVQNFSLSHVGEYILLIFKDSFPNYKRVVFLYNDFHLAELDISIISEKVRLGEEFIHLKKYQQCPSCLALTYITFSMHFKHGENKKEKECSLKCRL